MKVDELRERIDEQPAFPESEYRRRAEVAASEMSAQGIDVLALFDPQSICYFTGYSSVNLWDLACLVLPRDAPVRLVLWDFEVLRLEASGVDVTTFTYPSYGDPLEAIQRAFTGLRHRTYGSDVWTPSVPPRTWEHLVAMLGTSKRVDARPVLWRTRLRKSPLEMDLLRRSAAATDAGVAAAAEAIEPGVRDREIAAAAAEAMLAAGSGHFSIQPIVAIGPRAGVPHSESSGRQVRSGEAVFLELGAAMHRYTAPVMRTVQVGEAHDDLLALAELASATVQAAVRAMKPGVPVNDVVRQASDVVYAGDSDILFHRYFGYPVGISFPPSWLENLDFQLTPENDVPLEEGMVFHVPLSLRRRGLRGVGLSYTAAVGADGGEPLTGSPPRLIHR
jgi:Xaa-Pro dipeptidase